MDHRSLVLVNIAIVTVVLLATIPVAGQGTATESYTPPKTPDGQIDLQGFWTNATYTPLERPDGVTKAFYTLEEVASIENRRFQRESSQTVPGTIPDVHYDFTQFGLDRNQSGFNRNLRTSLIVDPPNGKLPPMTAEGKKREAADSLWRSGRYESRHDSAESNQLDDRCLMMRSAGPPMLNAGYNNTYQIVQSIGHVMILVEMIHDARIVPLDERPQPSQKIRQWMGFVRGHWEGDTLVVETTNFNGKNSLKGSSDKMRVTERLTRVADDTIRYRFTVEDETTWTRPWTGEMTMKKTVGPIFEHACHEGNYGLYNTLVGARLEEKKAAEETAKQDSK